MFIPDKEAGSTVNLQFRARNASGAVTEWSQTFPIGLPSGPTPTAPTGPTVAFSAGSFILDWTASTAPDLAGYRINASHATAGSKDFFVSKDQTSWTLSPAENDTAFTGTGPKEAVTFTVYAQGSGGTESTGLSFGLQTYPTMTGTITETCVPSVDTLTYFWNYPATGGDIVAFTRVVIDDNSDVATPTDTKDAYGNTIGFQVLSGSRYSMATIYDIFGRTLASAIIGPHTPATATADTTPPAEPTGLSLGSQSTTVTGDARITLTLTPPTDSDLAGYYVRYSTTDGSNWTYQTVDATTTNPTTQAIVVTGLVPSTTYYFQAASFDKAGNVSTSYTASVSAATNAIPTIETPNATVSASFVGGDLVVQWSTDSATYSSHFAGYMVDINGAKWPTSEKSFVLTAEENIGRLGGDPTFEPGAIDIAARDI
jgi:Fibronectin type III domain